MPSTTRRSTATRVKPDKLTTTLVAATVVAPALLPPARSTLARLVEYEIGQVIGRGGFGVAHRAVRRVISTGDTTPCCVKFIDASAISSWHREAYFGELLRGVPHVVQLLDTFVHVGSRRPRHVLVTELAEHGSLTTFLPRHGAFPERKAKAQVLGIARATDLLHRMHAVHRDLTPNNIFVMGDLTLKLADFGIAKHIAYGRGVQNDAQNPAFVHHLMRVGGLRLWKRKQDVYQLGQLLAMLISGNPKRHASRDVAALRCSDHMKGIIQRSIGPETGRYPTAAEFVAALQSKPQALRHQRLAALRDAVVVFTGALSITRSKAAALARRAGATVASSVTPATTVLVLGKPSKDYGAGSKGRKLLEYERLCAEGYRIRLINEATFLRAAKAK
jgi:eukaryotic-like serine/threonine-protein kinase